MSKTLAPSVTARDPKGLKFLSIVEAAYNRARLSQEEAQWVNESPGLAALVDGFIAKNRWPSSRFADEEVESFYGYPSGYQLNGIADQIACLRELFPELGTADVDVVNRELPPNAEGWFAIPKWQTLAPTYGEAVEKVLAMIAPKRKFYNYRGGELGAEYLRQHTKTVQMFQKLGDEQKDHDILVVPCQFGFRHRGRSVRRAREVMKVDEFGLGAFAVGCMILTHPEREVQWEQLHVDCAGDEYSPAADDGFGDAPYFSFGGDGIEFDTDWVAVAGERYGSASGFFSQ